MFVCHCIRNQYSFLLGTFSTTVGLLQLECGLILQHAVITPHCESIRTIGRVLIIT